MGSSSSSSSSSLLLCTSVVFCGVFVGLFATSFLAICTSAGGALYRVLWSLLSCEFVSSWSRLSLSAGFAFSLSLSFSAFFSCSFLFCSCSAFGALFALLLLLV